MSNNGKPRVGVIGAGIVGVSAALNLLREGCEVELVDRVPPNSPEQTSYGNAGILARCAVVPVSVPGLMGKVPGMLMDKDSPLFLRWSYLPRMMPWLAKFLRNGHEEKVRYIASGLATLLTDSVDQHQALAGTGAARDFINTGEYIYIYPDEADYADDAFALGIRRAHGVGDLKLNRAELVERDPNLSESYQVGACFQEHGWIKDPGGYLAALCDDYESEGGGIWRTEVQDISSGESSVSVQGQGESREYDRIVLSTGVWSTKLAERLGHKVALESERGYHIYLKQPSITAPQPYMVTNAKCAVTPMAEGVRCAGLVEFGGLEAGASPGTTELLERSIKRVYPNIEWDEAGHWLGHRPSTVDSLPLLGRSPKAPNIVFAFGLHHVGLTGGPKTGKLAAKLTLDHEIKEDLSPFRVGRFD